MRIEIYFRQVCQAIEACPVVQGFSVTYDKRGTYAGFISGEVHILDGSMLYLREFVDVEVAVERLTYVYHYAEKSRGLIFRYDNTGHHRKLNLPSYPHHKHEGDEGNVLSSSAPDLPTVLREIESLVSLSL